MHALHLKDYFTLENSLTGNIGAPTPAVMSFKVVWNATGSVNHYDNPDQQFRGDFEFQSAPLASSTTVAAELGQESNGAFY